jgi:hypothetical protein
VENLSAKALESAASWRGLLACEYRERHQQRFDRREKGRAQRLTLMSFAFDFARHFFQPCGIGRAGDQSAQVGGNRCGIVFVFERLRFPRWLYLAVSLQLGPWAAAQGGGGHVSSVD